MDFIDVYVEGNRMDDALATMKYARTVLPDSELLGFAHADTLESLSRYEVSICHISSASGAVIE